MVGLSSGVFRCVLLTPEGVGLDCRAQSLILPGYDGLIGILRNHAPMLCRLGSGIVQVKGIVGREDAFFLIDSGFARITENVATILAYDVITFEQMGIEEAKGLVARAKSVLIGGGYIRQIDDMDAKKAAQLVKLEKLSSVD